VIAASFRQVYGIDLRSEALHWFAFLELLRGLPSYCALGELIRFRTFDADSLPPNSPLRAKVLAAQRAAALPIRNDRAADAGVLAEIDEIFYDS